ncbi:hypothetical protein [Aurantibacillus circumpalustris]|nr:hypothetical protein [Aurantibacillus circumpalustris]
MRFIEDAKYFGLDFNPKNPEEAMEGLMKIGNMTIVYKQDIASATLK